MVVGSTQDPPGHDVEEDDELEMIRSMLRAEEDKDLEGRKNAHSKIISKLGASTSSLFTLSPVNEAVYDNDHLFDGAADDQQAGADPTNGTPQGACLFSFPNSLCCDVHLSICCVSRSEIFPVSTQHRFQPTVKLRAIFVITSLHEEYSNDRPSNN
jgi:hypothetical protein